MGHTLKFKLNLKTRVSQSYAGRGPNRLFLIYSLLNQKREEAKRDSWIGLGIRINGAAEKEKRKGN